MERHFATPRFVGRWKQEVAPAQLNIQLNIFRVTPPFPMPFSFHSANERAALLAQIAGTVEKAEALATLGPELGSP
jgi:hypothetical protein